MSPASKKTEIIRELIRNGRRDRVDDTLIHQAVNDILADDREKNALLKPMVELYESDEDGLRAPFDPKKVMDDLRFYLDMFQNASSVSIQTMALNSVILRQIYLAEHGIFPDR
jgi:hypothetical protein